MKLAKQKEKNTDIEVDKCKYANTIRFLSNSDQKLKLYKLH